MYVLFLQLNCLGSDEKIKIATKNRLEAYKYGNKAYELMIGLPVGPYLLKLVLDMLKLYAIQPFEDELPALWLKRLSNVLQIYYGSVEILRVIDPDMFDVWKHALQAKSANE